VDRILSIFEEGTLGQINKVSFLFIAFKKIILNFLIMRKKKVRGGYSHKFMGGNTILK
jgi:hypothetical protein